MAIKLILKEIVKTVAVGAGAEILKDKIIPPIAAKVKSKMKKISPAKKSGGGSTESRQVIDAEWR